MQPVLSPTPLLIIVVSFRGKVTCTFAVALTGLGSALLVPQAACAIPALKHRWSLRKHPGVEKLFDWP